MIRRSAPKKLGAKKLAALKGKPLYSTIKKKPRKKSETLRIYGPPVRREFVKSLPCSACGVVGYSENAHVPPKGESGTGYKADARFIAPLCKGWGSMRYKERGYYCGCHTLHDDYQWIFTKKFPGFDPEKVARETEELFRASLGSAPGGQA